MHVCLKKNGWNIHRIRRASATEMIYETKKPTDFPAADVVEVCRCEHCFKSIPHLNGRWCKVYQTMMQNSDYCSYGERKTGDEKWNHYQETEK